MRVLVIGLGKENANYRKLEGFYNAFSKYAETEWISEISLAKYDKYDIVFGEINLYDIFVKNHDRFLKMNIKLLNIWRVFDLYILEKIASIKPDTLVINSFKSNILDKDIISNYISRFGDKYQFYGGEEGVNLSNFLEIDKMELPKNLRLNYIPCSLSEKSNFVEDKKYDICYFGTIRNRPIVNRVIDKLSSKYRIMKNYSDLGHIMNPDECFELYKTTKLTLSQQVHPVILEYPVRIGESSANGCRSFLYEEISCKVSNKFIPDYTSCSTEDEMISKIEDYIENFTLDKSRNLYNDFQSTYENVVDYIIRQVP